MWRTDVSYVRAGEVPCPWSEPVPPFYNQDRHASWVALWGANPLFSSFEDRTENFTDERA